MNEQELFANSMSIAENALHLTDMDGQVISVNPNLVIKEFKQDFGQFSNHFYLTNQYFPGKAISHKLIVRRRFPAVEKYMKRDYEKSLAALGTTKYTLHLFGGDIDYELNSASSLSDISKFLESYYAEIEVDRILKKHTTLQEVHLTINKTEQNRELIWGGGWMFYKIIISNLAGDVEFTERMITFTRNKLMQASIDYPEKPHYKTALEHLEDLTNCI